MVQHLGSGNWDWVVAFPPFTYSLVLTTAETSSSRFERSRTPQNVQIDVVLLHPVLGTTSLLIKPGCRCHLPVGRQQELTEHHQAPMLHPVAPKPFFEGVEPPDIGSLDLVQPLLMSPRNERTQFVLLGQVGHDAAQGQPGNAPAVKYC